MKTLKFLSLFYLLIMLSSCTSNKYLHKTIRDNVVQSYTTFQQMEGLQKNDSIWLTQKTVGIKVGDHRVKVGSVKKGKETGKWYYYYTIRTDEGIIDTLDCYLIKKYTTQDTLLLFGKSANRLDW